MLNDRTVECLLAEQDEDAALLVAQGWTKEAATSFARGQLYDALMEAGWTWRGEEHGRGRAG